MSDSSADATPLLDEAALNDLRDMLEDALTEIVDSFLDGLDAEVSAIELALGQGEAAVRAAAHSLKGSAGNLGARHLAAQASAIEKAAMAGDLAFCQGALPALRALADDTRTALRTYMARA